jgi:hypothetical protein
MGGPNGREAETIGLSDGSACPAARGDTWSVSAGSMRGGGRAIGALSGSKGRAGWPAGEWWAGDAANRAGVKPGAWSCLAPPPL